MDIDVYRIGVTLLYSVVALVPTLLFISADSSLLLWAIGRD